MVAAFKMVEPFKLSDHIKAAIANGLAGMTASLFSQGVFIPIDVAMQVLFGGPAMDPVNMLYGSHGTNRTGALPGQGIVVLVQGAGDLSTVQRKVAELHVELQGRKEDMKVAHLTHVSEMEKKIETLARITTILKGFIQNKERITRKERKNKVKTQNWTRKWIKTVNDKDKSKPEEVNPVKKVTEKSTGQVSKSTKSQPRAKVQEK
ncbi:augmin subunit 2 [Tanacetum coccineum]